MARFADAPGDDAPGDDSDANTRRAPWVAVEGGGLRVTLVASRAHPSGGAPRVRAWDGAGQRLDVDVAPGATAFAEETTLRLRVDGPPGVWLDVVADDPRLAAEVETGAGWAAGLVRVGSTAGWLRLDVRAVGNGWGRDGARDGSGKDDGRLLLRLAVEIVPSKLDYRRDLAALTDDLGRLSDDLAAALVAPASPDAALADAAATGVIAPLALLDALSGDLDAAVRAALARPLGAERRTPADAPAHRARHASAATHRALTRRGDAATFLSSAPPHGSAGSGSPSPGSPSPGSAWHDARLRLPAPRLDPTLDTPEHRYLAFHIGAATRSARRVARAIAATTARSAAARDVLVRLADRLDALLALAPLDAARGQAPPPAPPLRATLAPGYRDALAVLAAIRQRLRIEAALRSATDALPARLRPLHALYETWAFLATAHALAAATGARLDLRRLVRPTGAAHVPTLARARIDVRAAGGVRLRLVRAPYVAHGLVPQRPDALLVRQVSQAPAVWHVLDAKYRLDRSPGTVARHGLPAPPHDALGALHRYRDALVDATGTRRVATAAALYPWRESASEGGSYAGSRLARSLRTLGVGAIPLLPGATDDLAAWIDALVAGDV